MAARQISFVLAAALLSSCASTKSYSPDQCAAIDWFALGKADGATGQSMTALNDEIIQCKAHGITADVDTYTAGRAEGLEAYCAPGTLVDAAAQGIGDPFSCNPMTDNQRAAFETGRDTRAAVARYQQLKAQYDQLNQKKAEINQEGSRLTQLYNQSSDQTERQQISTRLNQLRQQLQAIDAELAKADPIMQDEEGKYQAAVERYETFKAGYAE